MKKTILLLTTIGFCELVIAQSKITGTLYYPSKQKFTAGGIELKIEELGNMGETASLEDGTFEFKLPPYLPAKNLTLKINEDVPYSFASDKDSFNYIITPEKRGEHVKLTLYEKPVFYEHSEVPENYLDTYNSEYTIFLFTLSRRLDDKELWKIKSKLNTNSRIEIHSQYDFYKTSEKKLFRYTVGRFDKIEEAQAFLISIKNSDIPSFEKNPPSIVNLLISKGPHNFFRVQVRSSAKKMDMRERAKIETKLKQKIVELEDNSVDYKKYDYFVNLKLYKKEEAQKICTDVKKCGFKDAYVVRYEVLENKIVRARPLNKANPKKATSKAKQ